MLRTRRWQNATGFATRRWQNVLPQDLSPRCWQNATGRLTAI
nr:unnamed protein product [Digitaria exilis]